jgi:hypothetical protein
LACPAHAKTLCPNWRLHHADRGIGNWIGVEAMRDTIDMARKSKLDIYGLGCPHDQFIEKVKAFEALVRADEREAIISRLLEIGALEDGAFIESIQARGNT